MRLITLILICLSLNSCGVGEHLSRECHGDLKELCLNITGGRQSRQVASEVAAVSLRLGIVEDQAAQLNSEMQIRLTTIQMLETAISDQQTQIDEAAQTNVGFVAALNYQLLQLKSQLLFFESQQSNSQTQLEDALVELATLRGYTHVAAIIDPCGFEGNTPNEVILRLSDNTYLASFSDNSNGKNTRFTLLSDGHYQTTDGTACHFSIVNGVYNE